VQFVGIAGLRPRFGLNLLDGHQIEHAKAI
jgi:hypothetical protein